MFKFLVAFALLGLIQVQAGVINTFLDSLENELNGVQKSLESVEKPRPEIVNALTVLKDDTPENETCPTMDDVIRSIGDIIVDTTQIITGTIHEFYIVLINKAECKNMNAFRCFVRKHHELFATLVDVGNKARNYKSNIGKIFVNINKWSECRKKKQLM